ncbi:spore germination protein [uncultured Traorella sp.]|uniref:spore germination protein n=1 Tax=uncultured Traorella sp. TaxID=1929048 RepID=UPI0025FBA007|nr:spore germination protein [uncultured Traorella sp.]
MIERLRNLESFDIVKHEVILNHQSVFMMFLSSLTSTSSITSIIEGFLFSEDQDPLCFFNGSSEKIDDYSKAVFLLMSGQCLVCIQDEVYALETRAYPNRGIENPNIEKSIRGSHDSFSENILFNVGLIRRRIRSEKLKIELTQEGRMTQNDIAVCYMDDKADHRLLGDIQKRMMLNQNIEINNERNLVEVLYGKTLNPYPHVRYSERPDICAIHLLQGHIIILVDNMPSAMILPTTFFEQLSQIEEYTQTPIVSFFTRLIRYLGVFMSIYLLPFIIVCMLSPHSFLQLPAESRNIGFIAFQVLICELLIEWIRQSFLYAPNLINSMMGFLVVFVLGDFGIEMGAYTKEILLLVALSNLGNFLTPSYEVALANKIMRIMLTMLSLAFQITGFCIGLLIHFLLLLTTRTFKLPYLYPLFPFDIKELKRMIVDTNIYTK